MRFVVETANPENSVRPSILQSKFNRFIFIVSHTIFNTWEFIDMAYIKAPISDCLPRPMIE